MAQQETNSVFYGTTETNSVFYGTEEANSGCTRQITQYLWALHHTKDQDNSGSYPRATDEHWWVIQGLGSKDSSKSQVHSGSYPRATDVWRMSYPRARRYLTQAKEKKTGLDFSISAFLYFLALRSQFPVCIDRWTQIRGFIFSAGGSLMSPIVWFIV